MSDIMKGWICPYCNNQTKCCDSSLIYNGRNFGLIYICEPCDAYVGCHRGTSNALGRLAKKELRQLKVQAHKYFDHLWKTKRGRYARQNSYKWLAGKMNIDFKNCHIGMFDEDQCQMVIDICKPQYPQSQPHHEKGV